MNKRGAFIGFLYWQNSKKVGGAILAKLNKSGRGDIGKAQ
jgi:hypothetical protein